MNTWEVNNTTEIIKRKWTIDYRSVSGSCNSIVNLESEEIASWLIKDKSIVSVIINS